MAQLDEGFLVPNDTIEFSEAVLELDHNVSCNNVLKAVHTSIYRNKTIYWGSTSNSLANSSAERSGHNHT
eukprot:scaffold23979_cov132-Cylindrotheca_fusiformis.AAC.1